MLKYSRKVKPIFETEWEQFSLRVVTRAEFFLELAFAFLYILPAHCGGEIKSTRTAPSFCIRRFRSPAAF
jgi:hypothetical protein